MWKGLSSVRVRWLLDIQFQQARLNLGSSYSAVKMMAVNKRREKKSVNLHYVDREANASEGGEKKDMSCGEIKHEKNV